MVPLRSSGMGRHHFPGGQAVVVVAMHRRDPVRDVTMTAPIRLPECHGDCDDDDEDGDDDDGDGGNQWRAAAANLNLVITVCHGTS